MFAALSKFANDPGGVDERSTIIRQRRAESIIDLVLRPPNGEKIPRHRALHNTPFPCGTTKAPLQAPFACAWVVGNFHAPSGVAAVAPASVASRHFPIFNKMLSSHSIMMKRETFAIADIYVPTKRRTTLEQKRVDEIAASMLDGGQRTPILVRADGARFVLVEGLHRLEAAKALGEKTIIGFLVSARKH
jgi:sulfiredoxin